MADNKLDKAHAENKTLRSMLGKIHTLTSEFFKEKPTAEPIPYKTIAEIWNIMAAKNDLPQVVKITTAMKGHIRQRHIDLERDLNRWHNFFKYIANNDFLAGRASPGRDRAKPFRCTLLWATQETNFQKIAAKEYDQ